MREGGDLLDPLRHGVLVFGVELTQLPGVGDPAHAVTQDEQTHDGQADLGLAHLDAWSYTQYKIIRSFAHLISIVP